MSARLRRRARALGFVVAAGLAFEACGSAEGPDRWAARYRDGRVEWVPESSLPSEPQEKPPNLIYEVTTHPPGTWPTPEQATAAQDLVDRCFEAAKRNRWFQFKNALDQGYELLWADRRHFVKPEYVFDDRVLDCDRPEFLMYYETEKGIGLAGLMFYADSPTAWGPQVGGPLTVWHYHVWAPVQCLDRGMILVGEGDEQGRCAEGTPTHRSPEMLHVWFIDRPKGPFSSSMYLTDDELALLTRKRSAPGVKCAEAIPGGPTAKDTPWICSSSSPQ